MSAYTRLKHLRNIQNKTAVNYMFMLRECLPKGFLWGFGIANRDTGFDCDLIEQIDSTTDLTETIALGTELNEVITCNNSSAVFSNSLLGTLLAVIASELTEFYTKWNNLVTESICGLSIELLDEHENAAGINNAGLTIEERQNILDAYFNSDYENTLKLSYYKDYAEKLGYEIIITNRSTQLPFLVAASGVSSNNAGARVGDRLYNSIIAANILITIVNGSIDPTTRANFKNNFEQIIAPHLAYMWSN